MVDSGQAKMNSKNKKNKYKPFLLARRTESLKNECMSRLNVRTQNANGNDLPTLSSLLLFKLIIYSTLPCLVR
ncbi:CLUMA_CG019369, isoform A [Clunio marinus]|uniref:CLUMA_CG019369, isoform A n=1 Tax=Clunio marinus TaxID=568069 RepID=A0A1J1J0P3_9DIPT|nr:CLUMA_CG019369, isoform A [Clunio marinus]